MTPGSAAGAEVGPRVALFATCLGDQFFAESVADAVRLLRRLGVHVEFPPAQTCCGQPSFNAGHAEQARRMARHTRRVFRDAPYVVLPSGSCATMLRRFYGELLSERAPAPDGEPDRAEHGAGGAEPEGAGADGRELARRTFELSEFIVKVLGVEELGDGLAGRRIAYHHGCHALRELGLREEPRRLLANAGAELVEWEADTECCGFGGLFSVKVPEVSAAMADRKLDTLSGADQAPGRDGEPPGSHVHALTSTDGGCLLHLEGRIRKRGLRLPVRPLATLLWEATGGASWDP